MTELKRRYGHFPKLSNAFTGIIAIVAAIGFWVVGSFVIGYAEDFQNAARESAADRGATALAMTFSNAMEREWESLGSFASHVDSGSRSSMQSFADAVTDASSRIAWAAIVDPSGQVIVGSNGIAEGRDVSGEKWFRQGLRGAAFIQVTLTPEHPGVTEQKEDFVDMAMPIRTSNDTVTAVALYRLKMSWAAEYLSQAAQELDLDVFVVDGTGAPIIVGSANRRRELSETARMQLALGRPITMAETRQDVTETFSISDRLLPDAIPATGWKLVTVNSNPQIAERQAQLRHEVWFLFMAILVGLVAVSMVMVRHFVRPIEQLALMAVKISEGSDEYPEEYDVTRESAALSDALARIQARAPQIKKLRVGTMSI